jgi:hypothetical protein
MEENNILEKEGKDVYASYVRLLACKDDVWISCTI